MVAGRVSQRRERAAAAAMVAAGHALAVLLIAGGVSRAPDRPVAEAIRLIDLTEPPPPAERPPIPPPPESRAPAGGGAPEGRAAPPPVRIDAPPPAIRLDPPPRIAAPPLDLSDAATAPGLGRDGAGTGQGGTGTGSGTGSGAGAEGAGTGDGPAVRTRRIQGGFTSRDYPRAAARLGAEGTVIARLAIGANGRVADCRVVESSGNADLDATTCRLILRRFRFEPARDAAGAPTTDIVDWEQPWSLARDGGPEAAEAACRAHTETLSDRSRRRAAMDACMAEYGWTR